MVRSVLGACLVSLVLSVVVLWQVLWNGMLLCVPLTVMLAVHTVGLTVVCNCVLLYLRCVSSLGISVSVLRLRCTVCSIGFPSNRRLCRQLDGSVASADSLITVLVIVVRSVCSSLIMLGPCPPGTTDELAAHLGGSWMKLHLVAAKRSRLYVRWCMLLSVVVSVLSVSRLHPLCESRVVRGPIRSWVKLRLVAILL